MRSLSILLLLFTALLLPLPAHACMWDRDTPQDEATKNPDVYKSIIGWFDQNPDLYYQMRLDRVSKELEKNPDNLDLYDDAAVAADRLKKSDDAIAWMAKKRIALDKLKPAQNKDHEYRYLANLGTFHAHRWVRSGADRSNIQDLTLARDLIDQAIKLNPDAHFGREKVQLIVIDWLIKPMPSNTFTSYLPNNEIYTDPLGFTVRSGPTEYTYILPDEETARGVAGIITLGGSWNNFDLFTSLAANQAQLANGYLEILAWERAREIAQNPKGKVSLHPAIDSPQIALALIPSGNLHASTFNLLYENQVTQMRDHFKEARAQSDKRHEARTAFMLAKLNAGMHPDTHPDFWQSWSEPPFPGDSLGPLTPPPGTSTDYKPALLIAAGFAVLFAYIFIRTRKPKPTA